MERAVAKLIYAANMSLDGYTEDDAGTPGWAERDDAVFAFTTDLMRSAGTYLYGRRMYDAMAVWETNASLAAQSDLTSAFASVWQAADKVVYSTSMTTVATAKTRLERRFDPDGVRDMLAAAPRDVLVGGPNLAAQALEAGLAGRNPALPNHRRIDLALLDEHRFANGVVHLRYRVRSK